MGWSLIGDSDGFYFAGFAVWKNVKELHVDKDWLPQTLPMNPRTSVEFEVEQHATGCEAKSIKMLESSVKICQKTESARRVRRTQKTSEESLVQSFCAVWTAIVWFTFLWSFWPTVCPSERRTAAELKPLQVSWHRWLGLKAQQAIQAIQATTWHWDHTTHEPCGAKLPQSLWSSWIQFTSLIMFDMIDAAKLGSWRNLRWKG